MLLPGDRGVFRQASPSAKTESDIKRDSAKPAGPVEALVAAHSRVGAVNGVSTMSSKRLVRVDNVSGEPSGVQRGAAPWTEIKRGLALCAINTDVEEAESGRVDGIEDASGIAGVDTRKPGTNANSESIMPLAEFSVRSQTHDNKTSPQGSTHLS